MGLPAPSASRAVLIGVDAYEDEGLHDLPAVANNIRELAKLLTGPDSWGLHPDNCVVLTNPESPGAVLDALHRAAAEAEDAVLVYFAGHGLLSVQADLYLALPHSHSGRLYDAVAYDWLRHELVHECTARSRVVILDCCYSGRALQGYMSAPVAMADQSVVEGTYVMTAAAETKLALAPEGEEFTAFTGELLRVIADGVPHAPDPLDMHALYSHIHRELTAKGRPVPQQRSRNGGHAIALARNRQARHSGERTGEHDGQDEPASRLVLSNAGPPDRGQRVDAWIRTQRVVRRINRLVAGGTALAAVAGALGLCWLVRSPATACGNGMESRGGECIGVSDGSVSFAPDLADITLRIRQENDRIDRIADGPSVTIAVMDAMTSSALAASSASSSGAPRTRLLHELQGAQLAQYKANHIEIKGPAPKIRLVLANSGGDGAQGASVAEQLRAMADDAHHALRAVIGFSARTHNTADAIAYLMRHQVPVVTQSDADDIVNAPQRPDAYPGLVRVSPTITEQAVSLGTLYRGIRPDEALVVEDTRYDDVYVKALKAAFERLTAGGSRAPEQFDSRTTGSSNTTSASGSYWRGMAASLCSSPTKVIYFAGREPQLRQFLRAVARRSCLDRKFTVATGSDAAAALTDKGFDWRALGGGITVRYATVGHPDMWQKDGSSEFDGSRSAMAELKALAARMPAAHSSVAIDGSTIAAYDSALTAITAIRAATTPENPEQPPAQQDVSGWLHRFHGVHKFQGAGGWLCLDRYGNPYDKAVALVGLDPHKESDVFVSLAWPLGHPPAQECPVPPSP
ncbi:caspase, EACC1-associated type [Streptomyces sp. S186]|uniref:caspase, EACC1-associated type n=1 Tax=Streptomyces sp. S186 TaxID=3434395 RepID=UPI003F67F185